MKHALLPLLAAIALAGCEPPSPRAQCLDRVQGELPTLRALADETRANIERGYGISRRSVPVEVERVCETRLPDGRIVEQTCFGVDSREIREPMAIDLAAERAKLRSLETRLAREESRVDAARRSCIATYPE